MQSDPHYLSVLRYIEANPLRAGLVAQADQWPWSSFAVRRGRESEVVLSDGPVELPASWTRLVHGAFRPPDREAIGNSLRRSSPFGEASWVAATVLRLRLESTLRPRGRPRKST